MQNAAELLVKLPYWLVKNVRLREVMRHAAAYERRIEKLIVASEDVDNLYSEYGVYRDLTPDQYELECRKSWVRGTVHGETRVYQECVSDPKTSHLVAHPKDYEARERWIGKLVTLDYFNEDIATKHGLKITFRRNWFNEMPFCVSRLDLHYRRVHGSND